MEWVIPTPANASQGFHTCSCRISYLHIIPLQVRSMPIRKDDEVLIVRGKDKGKEGKVVQVSQPDRNGHPPSMLITHPCHYRSTVRSGSSTSSVSPRTSQTVSPFRPVSTPPTSSSPTSSSTLTGRPSWRGRLLARRPLPEVTSR